MNNLFSGLSNSITISLIGAIIIIVAVIWIWVAFEKSLKKAAKEIKEAEVQRNTRDERIAKALEKIAEKKSK